MPLLQRFTVFGIWCVAQSWLCQWRPRCHRHITMVAGLVDAYNGDMLQSTEDIPRFLSMICLCLLHFSNQLNRNFQCKFHIPMFKVIFIFVISGNTSPTQVRNVVTVMGPSEAMTGVSSAWTIFAEITLLSVVLTP